MLIPLIGIYPASAFYVFGALASSTSADRCCLRSSPAIGAAVALYLIFELTFQICCPRGGSAPGSASRSASLENLEALMHGFGIALSGNHIFLMVISVLLGILVSVLPGLGSAQRRIAAAAAPHFPECSRYRRSSCSLRMYWGALFGGSVTSILFNIFRLASPSSVATTFDGYPMARDGQADRRRWRRAFGSAAFGALAGVVLHNASALHGSRKWR